MQATSGQFLEVDFVGEHVEAPIKGMLALVSQVQRERLCASFVGYLFFCITFAVIATLARPVQQIFEIQGALRQELFLESLPGGDAWGNSPAGLAGTFGEVVNWAGFWDWAEGVLVSKVYSDRYYEHGDMSWARNATVATAQPFGVMGASSVAMSAVNDQKASHSLFTVGKYNRVITAIRFRQVRVRPTLPKCPHTTNGGKYPSNFEMACTTESVLSLASCGTPVQNHEMSRPCWGAWSEGEQDVGYPSAIQKETAGLSNDAAHPERHILCLENCDAFYARGLRSAEDWLGFGLPNVSDWTASFERSDPNATAALASCQSSCDVSRTQVKGGLTDIAGGYCGTSNGKPQASRDLTPNGCWGNVVDVPLQDASTARRIVAAMRRERWASEGTRALAVELNTYNANADIATAIRATVVSHPGGRLEPLVELWSCRLQLYATSWDDLRLVLEVLFVAWLGYYFVVELAELYKDSWAYLTDVWNYVELANLGIYMYTMSARFAFMRSAGPELSAFRTRTPDEYRDLTELAQGFNRVNLASLNLVYGLVRFTKYFRMSLKFKMLWDAMASSMRGVIPGLGAFLFLAVSFACSGHWLFGRRVDSFSTFPKAFVSLVLSLGDGLDLGELGEGHDGITAIWCMLWHLLTSILLVSFVVAAIVASFIQVKEQTRLQAAVEREGREFGVRLPPAITSWFHNVVPFARAAGGAGGAGGKTAERLAELNEALREVDLESLWARLAEGVLQDELAVDAAELAFLFRGNIRRARHWIHRVCTLAGVKRVEVPVITTSLNVIDDLGHAVADLGAQVEACAGDVEETFLATERHAVVYAEDPIVDVARRRSASQASTTPSQASSPTPAGGRRSSQKNNIFAGIVRPPRPGELRLAAGSLNLRRQHMQEAEAAGEGAAAAQELEAFHPNIANFSQAPPLVLR